MLSPCIVVNHALRKAKSTLIEQGPAYLIQKLVQKIQTNIYCQIYSIRGKYSLSLFNTSVSFSAPDSNVAHTNINRFRSEASVIKDMIDEIGENDTVYDIGANTGLYTLFAAKTCPSGDVIAFEPYPPNINLLNKDISRNCLDNVQTMEIALSNSTGNIEFNVPNEDRVGFGSSSISTNSLENTINVKTITGDQLIEDRGISPPNIVKIDVEGAEPLVIEGLEKALSLSSCRIVYCEIHLAVSDHRPSVEDFNSGLGNVRKKLESLGFRVDKLYERKGEVFFKAYK